MPHKPIQIVDDHDQPLRSGSMEEAQQKGLWHRIARVIAEDDKGRILLQKRSTTMSTFPGCWDTSASGHVDNGEDYLTAAKRELMEETGLAIASLKELKEIESYKSEGLYEERILNRFNKTYRVYVSADRHFVPDPDEVTELCWFSRQEIADLLQKQPSKITDGLKHALRSSS